MIMAYSWWKPNILFYKILKIDYIVLYPSKQRESWVEGESV